jgi:hypothetical protein
MAKMIYVSNVSVDGYIEDEDGNFDWTAPSDEVFAFITDLVRSLRTYLYGRKVAPIARLLRGCSRWLPRKTRWRGSTCIADGL